MTRLVKLLSKVLVSPWLGLSILEGIAVSVLLFWIYPGFPVVLGVVIVGLSVVLGSYLESVFGRS